MDKSSLIDAALDKLMGDMDDMEGSSAMKHPMEECPDPVGCTQHDSELGESMTPLPTDGKPDISIEIHKSGAPGEIEGSGAGEGLSDEEGEVLKKLLGK